MPAGTVLPKVRHTITSAAPCYGEHRVSRSSNRFDSSAQSIRRHGTVAIHCFDGTPTGTAGKGEDQRTILPSLNLTV